MLAVATAAIDVQGSVQNQRGGRRLVALNSIAPRGGWPDGSLDAPDVRENLSNHRVDPRKVVTILNVTSTGPTEEKPLVLDMSFVSALNPTNGTPWFRYKKVSDAGEADHSHFSGLTATGNFREDIIQGHNVVRHRAGLEGLTWSNALENNAARRLKELVDGGCFIEHSGDHYRFSAAGFKYVGENLYKVINMEPTGVDVADAWYAEVDDYTYGLVSQSCVKDKCIHRSSPPCMIGHFTQMMWQKTTQLGCARAECPNQLKKTFIAICHYGPGGNIGGFRPFENQIASNIGFHSDICKGQLNYFMRQDGGSATGPSVFVLTAAALLSFALLGLPEFQN